MKINTDKEALKAIPLLELPGIPRLVIKKLNRFIQYYRIPRDISAVTLHDFFERNQNLAYRNLDSLLLPTGNISEKIGEFVKGRDKTWQYFKEYLQKMGFDFSDMPVLGRKFSDGNDGFIFEEASVVDFPKEKILRFTINSIGVAIHDLGTRIAYSFPYPENTLKTTTVAQLLNLTDMEVERLVDDESGEVISLHKLQLTLKRAGFTEDDGEFMKFKFKAKSYEEWVEYYEEEKVFNHVDAVLYLNFKLRANEIFIPEYFYEMIT